MQKPQAIATWNPNRDYWETSQADIFGHSAAYSETLPKSGMTRDGRLFELPTWVPPHHRARVFLIAYPSDTHPIRPQAGHERPVGPGEEVPVTDGGGGALPNPDSERRGEGAEQPIAGPPEVTAPVGSEPPAPDAEDDGLAWAGPARHRRTRPEDSRGGDIDWGPYAPAVQRWERLTRPAPAPTELNTKGKPRLNAEFASWMMGLPEGHVTQVPGISRADQLKAIGNGVCVPQGIAAIHQLLTSPASAGHFS